MKLRVTDQLGGVWEGEVALDPRTQSPRACILMKDAERVDLDPESRKPGESRSAKEILLVPIRTEFL